MDIQGLRAAQNPLIKKHTLNERGMPNMLEGMFLLEEGILAFRAVRG